MARAYSHGCNLRVVCPGIFTPADTCGPRRCAGGTVADSVMAARRDVSDVGGSVSAEFAAEGVAAPSDASTRWLFLLARRPVVVGADEIRMIVRFGQFGPRVVPGAQFEEPGDIRAIEEGQPSRHSPRWSVNSRRDRNTTLFHGYLNSPGSEVELNSGQPTTELWRISKWSDWKWATRRSNLQPTQTPLRVRDLVPRRYARERSAGTPTSDMRLTSCGFHFPGRSGSRRGPQRVGTRKVCWCSRGCHPCPPSLRSVS